MVRESLTGWRSAWRGAAAGLLVGLVAVSLLAAHVFDPVYDGLQDRLLTGVAPDPQVTLVAIDQASQKQLTGGAAWPWSNGIHAQVIRNLARLHPKAIVVDVVFDRYTGRDPESGQDTDLALVNALRDAGNVVIACTSDDAPMPDFADAAAFVGDRGLGLPDSASAIRGVPIRPAHTCSANRTGESAFVQALRLYDRYPGPLLLADGEAWLGDRRIPTDAKGEMLIDFSNGAKATTCPYIVAFNGGCTAAQVTGKIVVVGIKLQSADDVYSQAVAFRHDASFCPDSRPVCMLDNQNYGYRILADELTTVLDSRYLRTQPPLSIGLAALLLAVLAGALGYVLAPRRAALALLSALGLYAVLLLAIRGSYLGDPLYAPLAITGGFVLAGGARYLLEERERRKLEGMFGQFVDPSVMRRLVALRSVADVRLGGERRPVSVLFCDVRGFTTLSENLTPEEVMLLVNDFTERCTRIVFEHGGTVDKYIGDCVMAFWNAPDDVPDHAGRAVRAALEIAASGAGLLAERGIGVGVGVCSGDAVIGHVGGERRKMYTAIGDVVNVASRLCGAAPAGTVLVAGATWELLVEKPPGARLKPMKLKGREAAVDVYSIEEASVASRA